MSLPIRNGEFMVRDDKILARNDKTGFYYPARFLKLLDSKYAKIKFENGTEQSISFTNVIKQKEFYHFLTPGDHVMAKVMMEVNNIGVPCWVPGVTQSIRTNTPNCTHSKIYSILYFNGQEGENTRLELLKISSRQYGFIVGYIRSIFGDKTTSVKLNVNHEEKMAKESQVLVLPDMNEIKRDIAEQLNSHLNSLKIEEKYDKIFDEFSSLKKSQDKLKNEIDRKFKSLHNNFKECKNQKLPIIMPCSNTIVFGNEILKNKPIELSDIKKGEEVLARWPDDGWYYRSIVREYLGNNQYLVEDSLKDCETFNREDLIKDLNEPLKKFEIGDCVVALHPNFKFSYAPGKIIQILNDKKSFDVKFYNSSNGIVKCDGIFKISKLKYETDVERILQLENNWIGKEVIARNNHKRIYESGKVIGLEGRQFTIEWRNGHQTGQDINHIFGKYTRNKAIYKNKYVLAPKGEIYLPGKIIKIEGNKLTIRFCDGSEHENVKEKNCFLLSKFYYEDAKQFCRSKLETDQ